MEQYTIAITDVLTCALALVAGYFLIYKLESSRKYNIATAIMLPWMPTLLLLLFVLILFPGLGFAFYVLTPMSFVFASVGGVWAHKKYIKTRVKMP